MSQKIPLFSPIPILTPNPNPSRSSTELRFSRWNNANADRFSLPLRRQQQIDDDLRLLRRHSSAARILDELNISAPTAPFSKSLGTPSLPSSPSIPGKKSKYSKPPISRVSTISRVSRVSRVSAPVNPPEVSVGEDGVSYRFEGAPFEFRYSYTETPRGRPLAVREEELVAPFETVGMSRPWTGRAPKVVRNLTESQLGFGNVSREEVGIEEEEVREMVEECRKSRRQLNMGRDGLIHNMLENIHAHWKRERVCKIKCKGVCTVDMDNVRRQLEEKTGGKIIYSKGGVIFLYRRSNYNYSTRPRYPLMLWKPTTPLYPQLVQRVPDGLTLEEATSMRKKGRQLPPICHLGKNGMYADLVKQVKEAFEACELARVNCKDLKKGDCRKIGAKLRDIVPCILVSFEDEHILVWRGNNWKSSFLPSETTDNTGEESRADLPPPSKTGNLSGTVCNMLDLEPQMCTDMVLCNEAPKREMSVPVVEYPPQLEAFYNTNQMDAGEQQLDVKPEGATKISFEACDFSSITLQDSAISVHSDVNFVSPELCLGVPFLNNSLYESLDLEKEDGDSPMLGHDVGNARLHSSFGENVLELQESDDLCSNTTTSIKACLEEVMYLLNQAVVSGAAVMLDDNASFDADVLYEKSIVLSRTAPPGLEFKHRVKEVILETQRDRCEKIEDHKTGNERRISCIKTGAINFKSRTRDNLHKFLPDLVTHDGLRVNDLAKLLA